MKIIFIIMATFMVAGCSVFGDNGVENAPYKTLKSDPEQNIEVRLYEPMVLVSTNMNSDSGNSAFRRLFSYITGANEGAKEIAMTAPVIMDPKQTSSKNQGAEIAMTAPVFMNERSDTVVMSFVMPKHFTIETTPKPTNPEVRVSELTNYRVVAIQFSGYLSDSNVQKHTKILRNWMNKNQFKALSEPVEAAYNGPLTLPWWRTNEVMIEIGPST